MYLYPTGNDSNGQPIAFSTVLGRTHRVAVRAQVEQPDGTVVGSSLVLTGGSVTVDRTAAVRRQCSISVPPAQRGAGGVFSSLIPTSKDSLLAPFGNLVRIFYGISVPGLGGDGIYWWPQGLFRLAATDVDDDGSLDVRVTGGDLSRVIARSKLTVPYIVAAGTNYGDAIIALALNRYPFLKARAHSVVATMPAVVLDPAQDPWAAITDWATAAGCAAYFDVDGYLVVAPEPDPTSDPVVWTYQDSGDRRNALLLKVGRTLSDDPGYNGVVLTSEASTLTTPIRSEVWDLDPSSPTYSLGPYGQVPKFVSNPYVATQTQGDAAARAELLRIVGGTEQISLGVVPNPAHEVGDVLRIVRPASGVNQTTVLEGFTLPFAVTEPMTLTFRERRLAA